MAAANHLSLEQITDFCRGTPLERFRFHFHPSIDSTNLEARRAFQQGAEDYSVYVAEQQTSGRGSHGRSWHSPPGVGLYFSILLKPDWNPEECLNLTRLAALAALDAMNGLMGTRTGNPPPLRLQIKPPNDLLVNGRKVCGILVESASAGSSVLYAVVGFGINVNHRQFPLELSESATSLFIESGLIFDRVELLCEVLNQFDVVYGRARQQGFSWLQSWWNSLAGDRHVS